MRLSSEKLGSQKHQEYIHMAQNLNSSLHLKENHSAFFTKFW